MKALVVSDSYGDVKALEQIIGANIHVVRHVFHLGDGCGDMAVFMRRYPDVAFHAVSGNCDASAWRSKPNPPIRLLVSIGGKKILATHGHKYNVKTSYDRICYAALEAGADICLFGHTHVQTSFEYEGIRFLNPGAVYQNEKAPNYAIIGLSNNTTSVQLNP